MATYYDVRLIGKREVAQGTMEFTVTKPADLAIRAGQYLDIVLPAPEETDASKHGFSLVNAPYRDYLAVATRMRNSAFKNAIRDTPIGTAMKVIAPFGDFMLHKNEKVPAVYIIGGIGITPVHSMIAQATHDKTAHDITLIYANRTPEEAAYMDELKKLAEQNSHFRLCPVYTRLTPGDPALDYGHVNADIISRHVPDLAVPKYYLAGPESMVRAMRALLVEMGADEDNIRSEEFEGY